MTPEKYKVIKSLLAQIIHLPEKEQSQRLDDLCGSQSEVKLAIQNLLKKSNSRQAPLLETPAVMSHLPDFDTVDNEKDTPLEIKQYKIISKIGYGGMGDVYLALQSYPAERQVAIKVLKQLPSQQRLFEETQILARLNHPNIATLHEVDKTEEGNMFIVMEYIEGEDILIWCEKYHFNLKQRIKLFQQLCSGISYAHEKGIIHCDIKPNNVLVTAIDETPLVKIIDFGISQHKNNQRKNYIIAGTPAYLAPEILNSKEKDITDTRRDVYALGVLLDKLIPEDRPNDLTAIIDKARYHKKSSRYSTASGLNNDLQRFLDKKPVKARENTTTYIVTRYVQRNFALVTFSAVLILSLVGGFIAQSIQATEAKLQAKIAIEQSKVAKVAQSEAEEVSDFLVGLFNLSNPERAKSDEITANELINKANDKLLANEAPTLSDARFMHTIGSIFTRMDKLESAKSIIEKSLEVKRVNLAENDDEIIAGITQLGLIHRRLKNDTQAEEYLLKAIELHNSKENPNLSQFAYTHNHLGNLYWQKNNVEKSIFHHDLAIELRSKTGEKALLADSYNNLGAIYKRNKKWDLSQLNLDTALSLYREIYEEDHPYIAFAENNLANVEESRFNWEKAEYLYSNTYVKLKTIYGESHQNTLIAQINLAIFYARRMRFEESNQLRQEAIRVYREKGEIEQVAKQLNRMAYNYYFLGDFNQSKQFHMQALQEIANVKVSDKYLKSKLKIDYSELLIEHGDFEQAKEYLIEGNDVLGDHLNGKYYYKLVANNLLAKIYSQKGKYVKSTEIYQHVVQLSNEKNTRNQKQVIKAFLGLGKTMVLNNDFTQAEKYYELALNLSHHVYGKNHQLIAKSLFETGLLKLSLNDKAKAKVYLNQALAMQKIVLPKEHPDLKKTQLALSKL